MPREAGQPAPTGRRHPGLPAAEGLFTAVESNATQTPHCDSATVRSPALLGPVPVTCPETEVWGRVRPAPEPPGSGTLIQRCTRSFLAQWPPTPRQNPPTHHEATARADCTCTVAGAGHPGNTGPSAFSTSATSPSRQLGNRAMPARWQRPLHRSTCGFHVQGDRTVPAWEASHAAGRDGRCQRPQAPGPSQHLPQSPLHCLPLSHGHESRPPPSCARRHPPRAGCGQAGARAWWP